MQTIFIDKENKTENKSENKNNCFFNCFRKKELKIIPFFEYNDNSIYIRIYHYNSNKFFKYYTKSMYNKIIDIDVKDINNFEIDNIDKKTIISDFIKDSITIILKSNYVINVIDSISNNLILLVLEKIYDTYKINKQLNTITE